MVFVAMGNEQALDAVLIFQYIGEIRNDKVHAEHIGIREHQAAVHQDHIALAFIQGDVLPTSPRPPSGQMCMGTAGVEAS